MSQQQAMLANIAYGAVAVIGGIYALRNMERIDPERRELPARELYIQALPALGIPRAVFDFIEYNLGTDAALAACRNGKPRVHNHVPGEACRCS